MKEILEELELALRMLLYFWLMCVPWERMYLGGG